MAIHGLFIVDAALVQTNQDEITEGIEHSSNKSAKSG
jgi:hypothetical protein